MLMLLFAVIGMFKKHVIDMNSKYMPLLMFIEYGCFLRWINDAMHALNFIDYVGKHKGFFLHLYKDIGSLQIQRTLIKLELWKLFVFVYQILLWEVERTKPSNLKGKLSG
ncbi:hypothetical protein ACJX0J_036437, partial [Zea mays]